MLEKMKQKSEEVSEEKEKLKHSVIRLKVEHLGLETDKRELADKFRPRWMRMHV